MSVTGASHNEAMRIYNWAKKNFGATDIFSYAEDKAESYFTPFDMENDTIEYGFDTILQLKEELAKMWSDSPYMQEVVIPCSVGAFKAKPGDALRESSLATETDGDTIIKDFVYVF